MLLIILNSFIVSLFYKTNANETKINDSASFDFEKFKHDELNIELKYINPVSPPGVKSKLCFRLIIGISSATFLFYLLWIINWILNFSMKNVIHLLLTLSFTLFSIEKIIYIIDYSINNLSEKNNQKIAIAHYVFVALSNFLFMCSITLFIHGFGSYYERPKIWIIFLCILISALAGLCPIINHLAFPAVVYFIFMIGVLSHLAMTKKQSDKSKSLQNTTFIIFLIYCEFYFFTLIGIIAVTDKKKYDLKVYLIVYIFELLLIIMMGFVLRMRKNTKRDYKFFNIYSIYNVDPEYRNQNDGGPLFLDIKNHVFSYSSFSKFTILDNVVKIGDYSFSHSRNLTNIEFSKHEKLKIIGKNAFSYCPIERMTIPSSVNAIGEYAFSNCKALQSIDFENNSQLTSFESNTFCDSSINSLEIPAKIENLKYGWCQCTPNLFNISVSLYNIHFILYENNFILGKKYLNRENYEILCFARRNIDKIRIPSFITEISPYAFENCMLLKNIDFEPNSNLKQIKKNAFYDSGIKSIKIPYSVVRIEEGAFQNTINLRNIEFVKKSKFRIISKFAFANSGIRSVYFPANVAKIDEAAFSNCTKLKKICFTNDTKIRIIENKAFSKTAITSFSIPPTVVDIKNTAFEKCQKLVCIEITEESELCSIRFCLYINSKAVTLFIPHQLFQL